MELLLNSRTLRDELCVAEYQEKRSRPYGNLRWPGVHGATCAAKDCQRREATLGIKRVPASFFVWQGWVRWID